jgi:host cell factor
LDNQLAPEVKQEEEEETPEATDVKVTLSEPSALDTEAATILTTIKSGEILSLQNTDLLAATDSSSADLV